ncbi:hypothetical protein ESCAB7627_4127 [Escherichia albertii TW07627]|uniref:Uncharacterized protein n=1 Tax=Escherichia albertii (strain TW07627) TaxID=502347 RepID=A0ABC9NIJ0_ESCAT|nr:hypothetical protein ESCAB7627_4127 [Escherichia albertii TW07627]
MLRKLFIIAVDIVSGGIMMVCQMAFITIGSERIRFIMLIVFCKYNMVNNFAEN